MLNINKYDSEKYNFKEVLINVLMRLGLDRKCASNTILLQDINSFLFDNDYRGYDVKNLKEDYFYLKDDTIEDIHNKSIESVYNYLKNRISIKQDEYAAIISRTTINRCYEYNRKDDDEDILVVDLKNDLGYVKDDSDKTILNIINKFKKKIPGGFSGISFDINTRRIMISKMNNYTTNEVISRNIILRFDDNYNIRVKHFTTRNVEVFENSKMISISNYEIEENLGELNDDTRIKLPSSDNYLDLETVVVKGDKAYVSVKKCDLKREERYPDINFEVDVSYDEWVWDFYEMMMSRGIDRASDFKDIYNEIELENYFTSEEYLLISKIFSDEMRQEIYSEKEDRKYKTYREIYRKRLNL